MRQCDAEADSLLRAQNYTLPFFDLRYLATVYVCIKEVSVSFIVVP